MPENAIGIHRVPLNIASLPFDPQVIAFLEREKASGRNLILATASHQVYADAIASHLGLFDRVFATHDETNLSAHVKRDLLIREYGEQGFDYLGNSAHDLPIWSVARKAYLANPEFGVEAKARRLGNVADLIRSSDNPWRIWPKQLRVHQWLKNLLVFVPLLASHKLNQPDLMAAAVLAFVFFSLCASSVYLLNDLLDLEDDRQHSTKRNRPLAKGTASIKLAVLLIPALLLMAFGGSAVLMPWEFALALGGYYGLTLAYSLTLKRVMTVDVIALAMLYTLRIIAGAFAIGVQPTFWMLAFSMFLFLSLALVKRYTELRDARSEGKTESTKGRGYFPADLEMIASLGAASGYLSVMVLALYIQDQSTLALYAHPQIIWLACPMLLYWITRTWMVAHRGWMHEDPVVFAIKDRNSLLLGAMFAAVFWFAT
jgi:4-hydroxybenzoate polyprenyltransferase